MEGCDSPWSVVIVVSPLSALIEDQVAFLSEKGIKAIKCIDCEDESNKISIGEGSYQLVFTSPEVLFNKNWCDVFHSEILCQRLVGFIVDEAHCVVKWYGHHYNVCTLIILFICNRGKNFRKEFGKLGELRGYFPIDLTFMALTATATADTRKEVVRLLGMSKPEYVIRSPDKPNIIYCVEQKTAGINEVFAPIVQELRRKRTEMEKTIVFCRRQIHCSELYLYFKSELGAERTEPIGKPDVHKFRLFEMFTASNSPSLKSSILKSFSINTSRLRIIFATVAFGMGVDVPGIHQIIHWSPPSNVETYIQETGRAGKDGQLSIVKLFYSRTDLSQPFVEESMKSYCTSTHACRTEVLFKDFGLASDRPIGCKCCDICSIHVHIVLLFENLMFQLI